MYWRSKQPSFNKKERTPKDHSRLNINAIQVLNAHQIGKCEGGLMSVEEYYKDETAQCMVIKRW
jgi:hypothetical protein